MQADETYPPRKRARTSATGDDPQAESYKRDQDFWYEDGTIILIAADVGFRVYRGPLEKHSEVFRHMFSFPQPTKTNLPDSVSNPSPDTPVVRLTESPNDLRHLLSAFMAGDSLKPFGESEPSFDKLSACIRLSDKYQIDQLGADGLAYLRRSYPNPLPNPRWQGTFDITRSLVPKGRPRTMSGRYAIGVVNLARLTGADDLLPLALLECCKLGAEIIQGFVREDGTTEHLSPEDLGRCFAAKDKLMQKSIEAALRIFASGRVDYEAVNEEDMCHDPAKCEQLLEGYRRLSDYHVQFLSVDSLLAEDQVWKYRSQYLCRNCLARVDRAIRVQRRRFWYVMPRLLRVDEDRWGHEADAMSDG